MINLRDRIQQQVFRLNGLSMNEFDLSQPPGDPGLFGPDSVIWRVHGDFTSMMCGGISALLLQMLHPAALAGVWDHSNFREDMMGRLRRTSQFIAVTTYGNSQDAQTLIDRVKRIHLKVSGVDSEGKPYAASDPHLLTWCMWRRPAVFWPPICATKIQTSAAPGRISTIRKRRRLPKRWGGAGTEKRC